VKYPAVMLTTGINAPRVEPWIGIAGRANGTSGRVCGQKRPVCRDRNRRI